MWEVTTVAAGASVRELLWDSAAWGVSRGRKPASRCIGAMDMPGSHGCVNVCNNVCHCRLLRSSISRQSLHLV